MHEPVVNLLRRQLQEGLPDLAGAEATATIPISDRLLTQLIAASLPPGAPVREIQVHAEDGGRIGLKVTLARPSFLPAIPIALVVHGQPSLPDHPMLTLRIAQSAPLVAMAERALKHASLPAGVSIAGDLIHIDLRTLLAARDLEFALSYVTDLNVQARAGAVVLTVRARASRAAGA
jgi:hypothetical protein